MKYTIIFALFLIPVLTFAHISVGLSAPNLFDLGTVHPNKTYDIGKVTVFNTGDEYGCFKMSVAYLDTQTGMKTPSDWVLYTPQKFCLDAGDVQFVDIKLQVKKPFKRGNYWNYIEACTDFGGYIGVCAGTKLQFGLNIK